MLENIYIVLVETSHPGNIGSTARAMKTMGLRHLILVNPKLYPHALATAQASGADDLLEQAKVVPDLDTAIAHCQFVVGASARNRSLPWPCQSVRNASEHIIQQKNHLSVAICFGRENSGLTNAELSRCHLHLQIPANAEYSALNLAQAVQVTAYELRMATLVDLPVPKPLATEFATAADTRCFFEHLEQSLTAIGFLNPAHPKKLIHRLKRFFLKAKMDKNELNIFQGILSAMDYQQKQLTKNEFSD